MKILHLDTYFLLPDDFEGDATDAIKELIKYRESKKLDSFQYDENKDKHKKWSDMTPEEKWSYFYDGLIDGCKHMGAIQFSKYDKETEEWTGLD